MSLEKDSELNVFITNILFLNAGNYVTIQHYIFFNEKKKKIAIVKQYKKDKVEKIMIYITAFYFKYNEVNSLY